MLVVGDNAPAEEGVVSFLFTAQHPPFYRLFISVACTVILSDLLQVQGLLVQ